MAAAPTVSHEELLDVLIIGGGVSGLAAAAHLQHKGIKTLVVEARDRLGGRIHSASLGPDTNKVDLGASFVHGKYGNPVYDMHAEVGLDLSESWSELRSMMITANGVVEQERSDRLQGRANQVVSEGVAGHAVSGDPPAAASLADYVYDASSGLSEGLVQQDLYPVRACAAGYSGWHGADLDDLSLRWTTFAQDAEGTDSVVKHGGYHKLVDWLAERAGPVLLGHVVTRVEDRGNAVCVTMEHRGHKKQFLARRVTCTLPLGVLKKSTSLFQPSLPPRKLQAIQNLGCGLLNKIVLRYETSWWKDAASIGRYVLLPCAPDDTFNLPPVGTNVTSAQRPVIHVFNQAAIDGTSQLVFFLGGHYGERIESASEAEVCQWAHSFVAEHLRPEILKLGDVPMPSSQASTAWRSDPFACGSYTYIPPSRDGKSPTPLDLAEFARPV